MLRFHLPLIKPDVRISRIRLSDKDFMRSPTRSCVVACEAGPGPASRTGKRRDNVTYPDPVLYASHTTTGGAEGRRGR